jgi:hypothetical protein
MSCYSDSYSEKQKKKEVFAHYDFIKNKKCCDKNSCEKLSEDIEELQHECDDAFRHMHEGEVDEKGLTKGTLCEEIKKTKNILLNNIRKQGGVKKSKRKTKHRPQRKRKTHRR